jgi:hypothetical protein
MEHALAMDFEEIKYKDCFICYVPQVGFLGKAHPEACNLPQKINR